MRRVRQPRPLDDGRPKVAIVLEATVEGSYLDEELSRLGLAFE